MKKSELKQIIRECITEINADQVVGVGAQERALDKLDMATVLEMTKKYYEFYKDKYPQKESDELVNMAKYAAKEDYDNYWRLHGKDPYTGYRPEAYSEENKLTRTAEEHAYQYARDALHASEEHPLSPVTNSGNLDKSDWEKIFKVDPTKFDFKRDKNSMSLATRYGGIQSTNSSHSK